MKKVIIYLFFITSLISCNVSQTYENRDSDKADAEVVINKLFEKLKKSDFENASLFFGDKFYEVTSKDKLFNLLETSDVKLGKITKYELLNWNSSVSEGAIENGKYVFVYKLICEKNEGKLKITLHKNENGEIKIVGYSLGSEAFLN